MLPKLWRIFCYQPKVHKITKFWHFKDHNLWVNMITRQMTSFFYLFLGLYPLVCFISRPSKLNSIQFSLRNFLSVKYLFKKLISYSLQILLTFSIQHVLFPNWYQFCPNPMDWMKHNYYNLNIAQRAVFPFSFQNINWLYTQYYILT